MFLSKLFKIGKANETKVKLNSVDTVKIEEGWIKIDQLEKVGKPSALREAVIEADKLVNYALGKIYLGREGAAERLKEAKEMFKYSRQDYENLWYAHKLRNELVHRVGFELPSNEAKEILGYFKAALEIIKVR